jgi:hypothetical protein
MNVFGNEENQTQHFLPQAAGANAIMSIFSILIIFLSVALIVLFSN